jgi:ABC-type nitrate/sulfonate/bicarbonate transport system permease component
VEAIVTSEAPAIPGDRRLVVLSVVGLFVIWHVVSLVAGRSPLTGQRLVPNAFDLVRSFDNLAGYWPGGLGIDPITQDGHPTFGVAALALAYNSLATALRLLAGLTLGTFIALALAAILGWSRTFRRMFLLPSHVVRVLPLLALAPLFNLWFGSTERGAVLFIAFATFAILFVVTLTALANVPSYYVEYAQSLGASRTRAYLTVVLPAGLPALRGGVLLALGFGWSMAIAAEFLGQSVGLGNIIDQSQEFGQTNTIAVVGIFVMAYGALSYRLAARVFDYLIRWAE